MKCNPAQPLNDVQAVYSGAEGQLWELIMGQQIHIGGLRRRWIWPPRPGSARGCRASISAAAPGPGCGSWSASARSSG